MSDPIPDPQEVAQSITGCQKEVLFPFCRAHFFQWPCPMLMATTERVRAAFEQVWDGGAIGAHREWLTEGQAEQRVNPYAKEN